MNEGDEEDSLEKTSILSPSTETQHSFHRNVPLYISSPFWVIGFAAMAAMVDFGGWGVEWI